MNTCTRLVILVAMFVMVRGVPAAEPVELPVGDDKVFSLAFSADGKVIAIGTGGSTPTVKVVNVASQKQVTDFPCEGRGAAFTVAFSSDSKLLAVGDYDLNVKVRNLADGSEFASLPGDPDRKKYRQARRVIFTPDKKQLVVGYSTGEIFVWDLASKKATVQCNHGNEITALAISPDGKLIASGTDFGLRLWNIADGNPLVKLDKKSSGEHQVKAVEFLPDGKSVVTVDSPGFVRVFATTDGKEMESFKVPAVGRETTVNGVGVSKDGKTIVIPGLVAGLDPQRPKVLTEGVVVLDAKSVRPRSFLPTGSARIFALSPDGKTAAISTGDRGDGVLLHDFSGAKELKP